MPVLILVVDDSPLQRKICSITLKAQGYSVMVAENGLEGVEMASQYIPALILMDVSMPEMDGPTAVQEMRHNSSLAQVPIIALTALSELDDLEALRMAGFDDVIDKNSGRTLLLEKVQQWAHR